jgi:DNA gyrase subunit A
MTGITLATGAEAVFFGAVATDDPTHGEPMVVTSTGTGVKVTPFAEYPAKGRATGGVRAQRFLKGESRLTVAWVGPRPVGATRTGEPMDLPDVDHRRDGSSSAEPAQMDRPARPHCEMDLIAGTARTSNQDQRCVSYRY